MQREEWRIFADRLINFNSGFPCDLSELSLFHRMISMF